MKYLRQIGRLEKKSRMAISVFQSVIDEITKVNEEYSKLNLELENEMLELDIARFSVVDAISENKKMLERFEELVK